MGPARWIIAEPVVGSLRGFRWWRVTGSWLSSPWRGDGRWGTGGNVATCLGRRDRQGWVQAELPHVRGAPESACSCGFYGMLHAPVAARNLPGFWPLDVSFSGGPISLVFGVVLGWGRVVLGERGWRAQEASVDALYVPAMRAADDGLRAVAERYGVHLYRDLSALCEERGPDRWTKEAAHALAS